jgi:hypothetical protein
VVVIVSWAAIAIENSWSSEAEESVARTVKLKVPTVVGRPAITPVDGFRFRPDGIAPWLITQVTVPLALSACNVVLYSLRTVPPGSEVVMTLIVVSANGMLTVAASPAVEVAHSVLDKSSRPLR